MFLTTISVGLLALGTAHAKKVDSPSSFPHNYSGIPKETYGSNWQNCASPLRYSCLTYTHKSHRLSGHETVTERHV
jgi:hypothetical protein